ncbi:uncharacterized protein LOC132721080 [Ruditapes philippinarum]|uniref:uncharacterized protein LOC132721080 n=1 Tax=Ruditapes philippinarum TaxID=129788 RepID=UPI00295B93A1|nr:uncharacterized protein LOC132721080 [Ruditapes philippinarum]
MRRCKILKRKTRGLEGKETGSSQNEVHTTRALGKCTCGNSTGISWWWPWFIVVVTACVRIRYVIMPGNWWILHPDEIFQSIEVAFSEVYGYGFRPYEYLRAPENISIPGEAQMLASGMYGLRSPIYPRMFMLSLRLAKMLGLDQSPFVVCRIFNAAVTSLLPVTVFWFVQKLFRCRLLAFLTCALAAIEHHLMVFGTHTIVNSFISPLVFLGLTLCLPSYKATQNEQRQSKELFEKEADVNANFVSKQSSNKIVHVDTVLQKKNLSNGDVSVTEQDGSLANLVTDVNRRSYTSRKIENSIFIKMVGGFLLGVVCYVRPDTILFCIGVILPTFYSKVCLDKRHLKAILSSVIGGALACLLCIADDISWYGSGIVSPAQWFKFNILSGKASVLFGTEGIHVYLQVFNGSVASMILNLSVVTVLVCSWLKRKDWPSIPREFCAICFSLVFTIIVYSFAEHKESRFIHNTIVLYLIIVSYSVHNLTIVLSHIFKTSTYSSLVSSGFLFIFAIASYYQFPSVNSSSISGWTYGNANDSNDVNICLDWLRRQHDVTGVRIDASLYDTAGFTTLKHDVPLLVKIHHEFYVFDADRTDRKTPINGRLRILRDYSDFIHESNSVYLTKFLSRNTRFNYVVTKRGAFSLVNTKYSYKKVFSYGRFHVFYRNFSSTKEQEIMMLSERLPVGANATVLEYESNWLITNAMYRLAIERSRQAMEIDSSRVRLYQQMFVCYSKLNDVKGLYYYQEKCFSKFGKEACVKKQDKVVIHEHYNKYD